MSGTHANPPAAEPISDELALFGPPPLYEGEDTRLYYDLLSRVANAVRPADIFEQFWVRDEVYLVWQGFQLRRLKANLMTASAYKGLKEILAPLLDSQELEDLSESWAARKTEAVETVTKLLASAGLTMDSVMAQTLAVKLNEIERIDRMIAAAEARRIAILREIDRHRETLGQKLRWAVQQAEENELRVVESTSINGTNQ